MTRPGANVIKLFTAAIYEIFNKSMCLARVFVPGKPFQGSLMFEGEARSLP
jgi:hypothetical protein